MRRAQVATEGESPVPVLYLFPDGVDPAETGCPRPEPGTSSGLRARAVAEEPRFFWAAQVQTEAFKAWFGLSKVVDEAGAPLRVMHGSPADFRIFLPGGPGWRDRGWKGGAMSGPGVWFTDLQEDVPAAHHVGGGARGFVPGTSIYPVFLKIERPLLIDDRLSLEWAREAFAGGSLEFPQILDPSWVERVRENRDYDGIIFRGEALGWGPGSNEYIVFEPTQVKSALGNRGTFDPSDPDMGA
jgi:hypothetical protein